MSLCNVTTQLGAFTIHDGIMKGLGHSDSCLKMSTSNKCFYGIHDTVLQIHDTVLQIASVFMKYMIQCCKKRVFIWNT